MDSANYLALAYLVFWLLLVGHVGKLWHQVQQLRRDLDRLLSKQPHTQP